MSSLFLYRSESTAKMAVVIAVGSPTGSASLSMVSLPLRADRARSVPVQLPKAVECILVAVPRDWTEIIIWNTVLESST